MEIEYNILLLDHPFFGFFLYPCYRRRTCPMLDKPGAQNIVLFEKQGK